jgi:fructose-1,6-bisphosphatase
MIQTKVQKRAQKTGENLQQLGVSTVEEVLKEIQFVSTNLRKSTPNFKALASGAKDQWASLLVELDAHEDTKILLDNFRVMSGYVKRYAKFVAEMARVVRRLTVSYAYALRDYLEQTIPDLLKKYSDSIPYTAEQLQELTETVMVNIMRVATKTIKLFNEAVDRLSAATPKIIERINWFLDISSGKNL